MLTDEMLASGSECGRHKCNDCEMERVCKSGAYPCANICRAVLAERKERENNPGVWDGSPEWAITAGVQWGDGKRRYKWREESYRRVLPKTKAREIAEKWAEEWFKRTGKRGPFCDLIESAIIEAQGGDK